MDPVVRGWRDVAWRFKGVLGEDAYQRYLEHHHRTHGGAEVLTEREFWRARTDRMDRDPQGRCC